MRRDPLVYTRHAQLQMQRRQITETDIEAVICDHRRQYAGSSPGRPTVVLEGDSSSGRLLAVVLDAATHSVVVTTYWRD